MEDQLCLLCETICIEELVCSHCEHNIHYVCGIGYNDPVKAFKVSLSKDKYVCPICIVGAKYKLIHLALDSHQLQTAKQVAQAATAANGVIERDDNPNDTVAPPPPPPPPIAHDETVVEAGENLGNDENGMGNVPFRYDDLPDEEKKRTKRFGWTLSSLRKIPKKVTCFVIGDSNMKKVDPKYIDPSGTVCVKGTGGLCLVSLLHGLTYCKSVFPHVKHVMYAVGTNDELHHAQHDVTQGRSYLKALEVETKRVFPRSKLHFIVPPNGLENVSAEKIEDLRKEVISAKVANRVHRPPNMRGKLDDDKVHFNPAGVKLYSEFLKRILPRPQRVFSNMSGRRSNGVNVELRHGSMSTQDTSDNRYVNALNYRPDLNHGRSLAQSDQPVNQQQQGIQSSVKDVLDQLARLILRAQ